MDLQFWASVIKMLIFLPFIIFLIYLTAKIGGDKVQNMQKSKYIKILERVAISKENSLLIVEIGGRGYVMSSTSQNMEILLEIDEKEINKIKLLKLENKNIDIKSYLKSNELKDLIKNLNLRRKNKHEEKQ